MTATDSCVRFSLQTVCPCIAASMGPEYLSSDLICEYLSKALAKGLLFEEGLLRRLQGFPRGSLSSGIVLTAARRGLLLILKEPSESSLNTLHPASPFAWSIAASQPCDAFKPFPSIAAFASHS